MKSMNLSHISFFSSGFILIHAKAFTDVDEGGPSAISHRYSSIETRRKRSP